MYDNDRRDAFKGFREAVESGSPRLIRRRVRIILNCYPRGRPRRRLVDKMRRQGLLLDGMPEIETLKMTSRRRDRGRAQKKTPPGLRRRHRREFCPAKR